MHDRYFQCYGRYADAVKVIRSYLAHSLMTLDRDMLVRLAQDRYGRRRSLFRPFQH